MNITEKIAYKERLITRTKVILAQGKYPTELLEQIKDERLLKEVMKEMMPSAGTAYELLNDEEKQQLPRRRRFSNDRIKHGFAPLGRMMPIWTREALEHLKKNSN